MTYLLDVNLLMALRWESHENHRASRWFRGVSSFATCPVAQLGFARVSSHPLLGFAIGTEQAFSVLRQFLADSRHVFVPDDLSVTDRVLLTEGIRGTGQITDHYLAALARQHGLTLATFDKALGSAFPSEPNLVLLVP